MHIRELSELYRGRSVDAGRSMQVCIVSSAFLGPLKNGGIGTATTALAKHLVRDGHKVTLLYTYVGLGRPIEGSRPWAHWVKELAGEGIVLERIDNAGDFRAWREASWLVKEFLAAREFDLVYFNDHFGSGYYSLLAKQAGLAPFSDQLHCVITHGSMEWIFSINDFYAGRRSDLEWMGLERRTVELADIVLAPSAYLLGEYERYGWQLPAQTFRQPYPVYRSPDVPDDTARIPIRELVFFGRLEVRKGLWLFCEALDRLVDRFPAIEVTFLGRVTDFSDISSGLQIVARLGRWSQRVRLLADYDQTQALAYLRQPGRLAVMPSLADNSPCVVYECIESGIPFVTTGGSGADELVDPACWNEVMVQPTVRSLTARLEQILEDGARRGRPRFDPAVILESWSAWHRFASEHRDELIRAADAARRTPAATPALDSDAAALIVILDNGSCPLGDLIDNLASHIGRFQQRAGYLIVSARRGELQDALAHLFDSATSAPLCILDRRMLDEARRLIAASAYAFFIDAETHLRTSFFIAALRMLRERRAEIVTCAVATSQEGDRAERIEELPSGHVPGLAALGEPIGSAAWAVALAQLNDASTLELYNARLDAVASAGSLGQSLMQRCLAAGNRVQVVPVVGAVERRGNRGRSRSFRTLLAAAEAHGVEPAAHPGSPAWFAISSYFADAESAAPLVDFAEFMPPQHPLRTKAHADDPADAAVPLLAAAFGREQPALRLEAERGSQPARVRRLSDIAAQSARLRPPRELADLFADGTNLFEFGRTPIPRRPDEMKSPALATAPGARELPCSRQAIGRVYFDGRRFVVCGKQIRIAANGSGTRPSKLYIFDVPVCGHETFVVRTRADTAEPSLHVKILDQALGEEIGTTGATLSAGTNTEMTIPLRGMYVIAAIVMEFRSGREAEVTIESLAVR